MGMILTWTTLYRENVSFVSCITRCSFITSLSSRALSRAYEAFCVHKPGTFPTFCLSDGCWEVPTPCCSTFKDIYVSLLCVTLLRDVCVSTSGRRRSEINARKNQGPIILNNSGLQCDVLLRVSYRHGFTPSERNYFSHRRCAKLASLRAAACTHKLQWGTNVRIL